jgi:hypothetical protein
VGLARRSLPLAVTALALASAGVGFARVWPELGRQHDRYAHQSRRDVVYAGAIHEHLDVARLERWRAQVRPDDRWYTSVDFIDRTFLTYLLLPAVPAESPADATVVLR